MSIENRYSEMQIDREKHLHAVQESLPSGFLAAPLDACFKIGVLQQKTGNRFMLKIFGPPDRSRDAVLNWVKSVNSND